MNDSKDFSGESISETDVPRTQAVGRIDKVTKLEVRFEVPGVESKKLYANGRMQVRVWVFVEAADAEGNPVPLSYYPDLISTKLIHYHNGKPLEREVYTGKPLARWNSSYMENKYSHEMPGGFQSASYSARQSGSRNEPLVFWVSSSEVAQVQIAAEVTLQGKVYRSNNTTNPDGRKINKSIMLYAEQKVTFSPDQFRWQSERVGGEREGDLLYRYHLGLYPNSRQFKLLSWESSKYNPNNQYPINFCNTGSISGVKGVKSFVGEFPSAHGKKVQVGVPGNQYVVDVHQRSGELSVVQGISSRYAADYPIRIESFPFTAIDEYGNDHKLSIGIDVSKVAFVLQRG